jgi:hypothetical protein
LGSQIPVSSRFRTARWIFADLRSDKHHRLLIREGRDYFQEAAHPMRKVARTSFFDSVAAATFAPHEQPKMGTVPFAPTGLELSLHCNPSLVLGYLPASLREATLPVHPSL